MEAEALRRQKHRDEVKANSEKVEEDMKAKKGSDWTEGDRSK
jgi:hypothetical protein